MITDKTLYFVSLGCSKNLVDSQVMLGSLAQKGYQISSEPDEAEVLIVNTCAFVDEAKRESVQNILSLGDQKKEGQTLVVSGCLAQRYFSELEIEIPEVDLFIGTGEYHKIDQFLEAKKENKLAKKSFVEVPKFIHTEFDERLNTSPGYMAWLKVSEGCNRKCTFCIIPKLRGELRSRSVDSLVAEAKALVSQGVKELNIISQDLSSYGVDLDQNENNLLSLLQALETIEGLKWVRLFYYYPDDLSDEVIDFMSQSQKTCAYLDMPVQHFSDSVLKRMNRKITGDKILERVSRLKEKMPQIVIRTSVIVGFPGETDEDFEILLDGIQKAQFDHLGVFKYSDEEGTPAYRLEPKVPQEIIEERFEKVYQEQEEIVSKKNQRFVGNDFEVMVEGLHEETELLYKARFYGQAPDIDGCVIINDSGDQKLRAGDFVKVKVTDQFSYDLVGEVIS